MKSSLKNRILFCLLVAALPLLVVSCLFFDNIIQPESALVESEIEITAQLRVAPETNGNGRLVFAMLAPKAWNLKENATLLLTTTDYVNQGYSEIVNESLTPMPDTETDPKNGMAWSASFASVIGMVLLFAALSLKWVRPGAVKRVSTFLLDNMMLFFVPVGVGLITSYTLLSRYMLAIIVASLVSTVLVIAVVGLVEQKLESKRDSVKNGQKEDAGTH